MSTMKNFMWTMAAGVLIMTAAIPAAAQDTDERDDRQHQRGAGHHWQHGGFDDPSRLVEMLTRRLELDAAQTAQIENIVAAVMPEAAGLRERASASRDAVRSLDVDAADYGATLQNLSTEIGALASEATLLHGRVRADVYAVLTPEQREQAEAIHADMREHSRSQPRREHD
jgi:Spy/CpxP family protein refolding chaperone